LLYHAAHLLSGILEASSISDLVRIYGHQPDQKDGLSKRFIHTLLINSVLPAVFLYGKRHDKPELCEKAISFYEELPAEDNHVVAFWGQMGINSLKSFHSQALLELKTQYCDQLKCLQCAIGQNIITS